MTEAKIMNETRIRLNAHQRELLQALHQATQLDTPAARSHRQAWGGDWWAVSDLHRHLALRTSMTPGIAHRAGRYLTEMQLADRRKYSGVIFYRITGPGTKRITGPVPGQPARTVYTAPDAAREQTPAERWLREKTEPPAQLAIVARYEVTGGLVLAVNERGQVGWGQFELRTENETYKPLDLYELQEAVSRAIAASNAARASQPAGQE
jgi:hypothetical protein